MVEEYEKEKYSGVIMAENIKLIQWIDSINRDAATTTFEPSVELQIALRFEDLNNKLARLDDVEGLARFMFDYDKEHGCYSPLKFAEAVINYIKGE